MSENVYSRDKGGYRPPYGDRSGYSSRRDDRSSYGSRPSYGDRTRFETAKERREREEAEFLRRNEEAKSRPIKAEKAVGPQAVSVNLDKRMGILERNAHARMTEVYRAASEYLEKGDPLYLKQLKMVCEHFESDPYNSYAATAQNYIMANTHKIFGPNSEKEVKKLAEKMLDARSALEAKNILKISQGSVLEKTVAQYMKDKSPEEQWHSVKSVLSAFRKSPTAEHQEAFNSVLAQYGYSIVKIENRETPVEVRQVVRAVFDGTLKIPTEEDTQKGIGYSKGYQDFLNGKIQSGSPTKYNFDTKLFRALEMSDNTEKLGVHIKDAIRRQRLPQEVVDNLSLSDAAHMLYEARYHRTPQPEENISFQAIEPNCDEGLKTKFWKDFAQDANKTKSLKEALAQKGVSKEYISFMMESIRESGTPNPTIPEDMHFDGPIPSISLHHKFYIQDAAFHKDMMKVDDPKNYEVVIDYPKQKTHEELKHGADCISPDGKYAYRLVYTDDGAGRDAFISDGLKTITTTTKDSSRMTYNRLSQKGERE